MRIKFYRQKISISKKVYNFLTEMEQVGYDYVNPFLGISQSDSRIMGKISVFYRSNWTDFLHYAFKDRGISRKEWQRVNRILRKSLNNWNKKP